MVDEEGGEEKEEEEGVVHYSVLDLPPFDTDGGPERCFWEAWDDFDRLLGRHVGVVDCTRGTCARSAQMRRKRGEGFRDFRGDPLGIEDAEERESFLREAKDILILEDFSRGRTANGQQSKEGNV